jgi:ATP-dependent DNA helicase RecQ
MGQSGIVYCFSRKTVEQTAKFLTGEGIKAAHYHAGMGQADREAVQEGFMMDKIDVIVATIAFGMGIDKADVRYVVHGDMPKSIEGYSQEIGRAGRDGEPSDCILFYSWPDKLMYDRLAEKTNLELAGQQAGNSLKMYQFADDNACRHQALARHFGEHIGPCKTSCAHCNARKILSASSKKSAPEENPAKMAQKSAIAVCLAGADEKLFNKLRVLRLDYAKRKGVSAFVIFYDSALKEMAQKRPLTDEQFLSINGVGKRKLEEYGEAFMDVIRAECAYSSDADSSRVAEKADQWKGLQN